MRVLNCAICALVLSSGLIGAAHAQSAKDAIAAHNAEFVKAFNAKDGAKVASFYSEDGAVLPSNGLRVDGRANLQKFWQGAADAGLTGLTITTQEVQESGNWASEIGTFTLKIPDKDGKLTNDVGKFVVVHKKEADGKWYLYRDIWNDDPPKAQ